MQSTPCHQLTAGLPEVNTKVGSVGLLHNVVPSQTVVLGQCVLRKINIPHYPSRATKCRADQLSTPHFFRILFHA